MADRDAFREQVAVPPRFRCLICQRFVVGSNHGTCPRCGWKPPAVAPRPGPPARGTWTPVAALVVVIAAGALAAHLLR